MVRHAPAARTIVDIGAGDGFVAAGFVARGCHVVAVDPAATPEQLQHLRNAGIDARTSLPNEENADVALLLDVIEHVENDTALLKQAALQVSAHGIVVVTVPAWPALFSAHDTALGHHRRYTRSTLRAAIAGSDLELVDDGALFSSLLLPRALQVVRERWAPPSSSASPLGVGQFEAPALVATALAAVLDVDARLTQRLRLPGLSLFAVARKRSA